MKYLVGAFVGALVTVILWLIVDLVTVYALNWYTAFSSLQAYCVLAISGALSGLVGVRIGRKNNNDSKNK